MLSGPQATSYSTIPAAAPAQSSRGPQNPSPDARSRPPPTEIILRNDTEHSHENIGRSATLWTDTSKPPGGYVNKRGARKCPKLHAFGSYYLGSERRSCGGCGGKLDDAAIMPRDLPKQTFAINPRDQDEDYSPRMDWKKKPDSKR